MSAAFSPEVAVLAKCSRCSQTFNTDRFGEQFCPFCGAAVMIADPNAAQPGPQGATPGALPPPGPAEEPGQDAPMDNPAQHGGWVQAYLATWKLAMFEPTAFFNGLKVGKGMGGAMGFAAISFGVGGFFAGLFQAVTMPLQMRQVKHLMGSLPNADKIGPVFDHVMDSMQGAAFAAPITQPITTFINFFVVALLLHLGLMLVGGNKRGINATLRALGYASGPYVLEAVPCLGGCVSPVWMLVLGVIGLAAVHRISPGRAFGAVAVLVTAVCCLCCLPTGGLVGLGIRAAQQAQHQGNVDLPPMPDMPDMPDDPGSP